MATVIPAPAERRPRGAQMMQFMLSLSQIKYRREAYEKERIRRAAVDKSLGAYRAGILEIDRERLTQQKARDSFMVQNERAKQAATQDKSYRSNLTRLYAMLNAKVEFDYSKLKPGETAEPETFAAVLQGDTIMKQLIGMPYEEIGSSQAGMTPWTKPEDKMTEAQKDLYTMQYVLPALRPYPEALESVLKGLDIKIDLEAPTGPTGELTETQTQSYSSLRALFGAKVISSEQYVAGDTYIRAHPEGGLPGDLELLARKPYLPTVSDSQFKTFPSWLKEDVTEITAERYAPEREAKFEDIVGAGRFGKGIDTVTRELTPRAKAAGKEGDVYKYKGKSYNYGQVLTIGGKKYRVVGQLANGQLRTVKVK